MKHMTLVQAAKTTDGKLFDRQDDARAHQVVLDLAAWLDRTTNGGVDKKAITEFVLGHEVELRDILTGKHTESRTMP